MFVDHILAIGGLSSASTLLRTCIYVRPGVARVAAAVIQGHISFDANISLFTPESDLVTQEDEFDIFTSIWYLPSLSLSPRRGRAGGYTQVNIINWPLLPPPRHSAL